MSTQVWVLGPLEMTRDGVPVALGGKVPRRLLSALLTVPGQVVSTERLVEAVWGEMPPASAVRTLQRSLSRLRSQVGVRIERDGSGYRLVLGEARVDLVELEEASAGENVERLRAALAAWRGAPFPELADWEPAVAGVARLGELRLAGRERVAGADLTAGRAAAAVADIEALVGESPLRESGWVLLVDALRLAGRRSDALAAFSRARTTLAHELGIEPSTALQEAEQRVLDDPHTPGSGAVPVGTVTFLFTDVEGSTTMWEADSQSMAEAIKLHDEIVGEAIDAHGGYVFSTAGDSFAAAFARADEAVTSAIEAQRSLLAAEWPMSPGVRVRIGLCTGEVQERDGDYFGLAVNRAARVMGVAHPGQVLMAESTRLVLEDHQLDRYGLVDLGTHRLRGMARTEHLWQVHADGLDREFPPIVTGERVEGTLPRTMTALIGREPELDELRELVSDERLVTLIGVGGTGKTRLALATASDLRPRFTDGRWWCELGAVDDPGAVSAVVAEALGLLSRPGLSATEVIVEAFRSKRALVVLDNCEHLLDQAAELVDAILDGCADVSVLATSREPLRCRGERVWSVPSLDPATAGVELFDARAAAAHRSYVPGDPAVEQICLRLDGLPLALELAAARVRTLAPGELLARLDDRFRLLSGGRQRGLERHQTLANVVDWSYRLLDDEERVLFDRLAVFAGGFDLAGAEKVCAGGLIVEAAVVDLLERLVDRSLVVAQQVDHGTRFRLLETLRQYAEARLTERGEIESTRNRHREHYIAVAERADDLFSGDDWWEGTSIFELEWDNLRAAVSWALTTDNLDAASRLVEAISWFGGIKIRHEHERWALEVVGLAERLGEAPPPAVAGVAGWWAARGGRYDESMRLGRAGIDAAAEPSTPATCWAWHALAAAALVVDTDGALIDEAFRGWESASHDAPDILQRSLFGQYSALSGNPDWVRLGCTVTRQLAAERDNPCLRIWDSCARGAQALGQERFADARRELLGAYDMAKAAGHHIMEVLTATVYERTIAQEGGPFRPEEYRWVIDATHARGAELPVALFVLASDLGIRGMVEHGAVIGGNVPDLLFWAPNFRGPLHEAIEAHPSGADWMARGAAMNSDEIVEYVHTVLDEMAVTAT